MNTASGINGQQHKLKIARRSVRDDVAHVSKIKAALGDRAKVTVDVKQAWNEVDAALGVEALEAAGIDLIEQPTPREQRGALARLASRFIVPIMADDAVTGPEDALELVRGACADVFALKIAKSGGIYGMMRTAAIADAAGVSLYGGFSSKVSGSSCIAWSESMRTTAFS